MVYQIQASDSQRRKAKTRRLLKRFQEAVIESAFKGTQDPADHAAIDEEYQRARKLLLQHIDRG